MRFSISTTSTATSRASASGSTPRRSAARRHFRLLLIGYFEGLDAERAIAWRAADLFALREFLGLVLPDASPDHSTISRTRRLIDVETHEAVFTWILQRLAHAGLVKGKTVGIDATTLEANAALRSLVRRDTGESYHDFLTKLASGCCASAVNAWNFSSPISTRPAACVACSYVGTPTFASGC